MLLSAPVRSSMTTPSFFSAQWRISTTRALSRFNKADGKVKWETKMPTIGFAHSTPLLIDVDGKPQILVLASGMGTDATTALQSFNPATGERIWHCRGGGDASSPAYGNGLVFFDSGRGGPLVAVEPTGSGDVGNSHIKWTSPKLPEAISSPLVLNNHVYRLHSPNVLKCYNATTGAEIYSQKLDGLTSTWSSPIATADGYLFLVSGGRSVVVKAGPQFELVSTNDLNDPNHASPAVAKNRLYVLGLKNLHCIAHK